MYQWKRQIKVAAEVVCQVPDLQAIIAGDIKHLFFSQLENLRETCLALPWQNLEWPLIKKMQFKIVLYMENMY